MCRGMQTAISRCATLMVAVGVCALGSQVMSQERHLESPEYTDQELFHGLVLGHGPVAQRIPALAELAAIQDQLPRDVAARLEGPIERFHQRLIATVAAQESAFFSTFGAAIRSGDHLRIASMLRRARRLVVSAIESLPEVRELRRRIKSDPTLRSKMLKGLESEEPRAKR